VKNSSSSALHWTWKISAHNLIIRFAEPHRVLSWASLGADAKRAETIVNHQVKPHDRNAVERPRQYLTRLANLLRLKPGTVVAMMTAADVRKTAYAEARRGRLVVGAWCTAGCSNALRIGDPATEFTHYGTINLAVVINQRLSGAAMAEALTMATEARVVAVQEAGIMSTRSRRLATGTGTDCIVVASPSSGRPQKYCGKHTLLGELIGKATLRSCARALRTRVSPNTRS